jgi:hypothetical protein
MPDTAAAPPGTAAPLAVSQRTSITPVSAGQAARATKPAHQWSPEDFAAFVTEEIHRACGEQLPCRDAQGILTAFFGRFGAADAVRIAKAAFELYGGFWAQAPVTVRRFADTHDDFFARPILEAVATDV